MISRNPTHLGVGLYSIAEASRILHIPKSTVHRWASPSTGLVPRHFDPKEQTLTFVELMELHFIQMFRSEGVSLPTIKKTSAAAAKRFGTAYPFCVKRFDTDGNTVFATLIDEQKGTEMVEDLRRGQYVFREIVKPFFKKLDYDGAVDVARYWPMEKKGRVVLDPERKFGKPIDAETGIPTRTIYDAMRAGSGQEPIIVADWLGIPLAAVEAAVAFERSLAS